MLNVLGWVLIEEGRVAEAVTRLRAAPALASRADDLVAEANALIVLAVAQAALGDPAQAARGCERAVELARTEGNRTTERLALQHLARHRVDAGKWRPALDTVAEALAFGNRPGTADVPRILLLSRSSRVPLTAPTARTEASTASCDRPWGPGRRRGRATLRPRRTGHRGLLQWPDGLAEVARGDIRLVDGGRHDSCADWVGRARWVRKYKVGVAYRLWWGVGYP